MPGGNQSLVEVTLRNPLSTDQQITYYIKPFETSIGQDWVDALKKLVQSNCMLEKNFCFMGWPNTSRSLEYLCAELNRHIKQINEFNKIWKEKNLEVYIIEDWFSPDVVRWGEEYPTNPSHDNYDAKTPWVLGGKLKHSVMNRLHNHFEILQGTVENLSPYYLRANDETRYAIRQLNNICHEIENLVLSQRKQKANPDWIRPSQITTWIGAARYELTDNHRNEFLKNRYNRRFGHAYIHWTQIGKTLFEVWRDEGAPMLDSTICDAITHLKYFSGEFDVEWGKDVVNDGSCPWHDQAQEKFQTWLKSNGLDPDDTSLSLGYLPVGEILLEKSFGTTDRNKIWDIMSQYLDIYRVRIGEVEQVYDYCWSDKDHQAQQLNFLKKGYRHHDRMD